jgi:Flp pilus assembly protein TadD
VLALLGGALLLLRKKGADGVVRAGAFGVLWYFLTSGVESSVIPIADVMVEHRAYLPSVGFFIAAAFGGAWAAARWSARWQRVLVPAAVGLSLILAAATRQRNEVWATEISLWTDVVAKSPGNARAHESLGTALGEVGRGADAAAELATAIRLAPERPGPYYNLGRLFLSEGVRTEEAVALLGRAVVLKPDYGEAYANLAGALNRQGRYAEAVRLLESAAVHVDGLAEAQFNLAIASASLGDRPRAEVELARLRRSAPGLAAQLDEFLHR